MNELSKKELAKLVAAGKLWEIHGKYYDFIPFIKEHPGGKRFLLQCRGMDATTLLETTHLFESIPRGYLKMYEVGKKEDYQPDFDWDGDGFYPTLKKRVQAYLLDSAEKRGIKGKEKRLAHHGTSNFLFRLVALYVIFIIVSIGAIGYGNIFCALIWGPLAFAIGGYGHEAMHGGVFASSKANRVLALFTLDIITISSYVFTAVHVPLHHIVTNVPDKDPDIEVHFPMLRLRQEHEYFFYHKFQHFYVIFLYMITLPILSYTDVSSVVRGNWMGPYGKMSKIYPSEFFLLILFKVISTGLWYVLPFIFLDVFTALLVIGCMLGGAGIIVQATFGASHQCELAMNAEKKPKKYPRDWGSLQVESTVNFEHGNWFLTMMTGGLGYQIEHHLFPTISYSRLHEIAPIVKETCKEFDLPYHYYPTLFSVYRAHFSYIKSMSKKVATV